MNEELKRKYQQVMGKLTFTVISIVVSAIALSLPLLLASNGYMVITLNSYFTIYFMPIALALFIIILITYQPYVLLFSGQQATIQKQKKLKKMNILQFLTLFLAGALLLLPPIQSCVGMPKYPIQLIRF